jgi:DNA-3-methyladenine glycosylase II
VPAFCLKAMAQSLIEKLNRTTLDKGISFLCKKDPDLASIVKWYGSPPMWARTSGFSTLVHIILEQQVSLASAKATFVKLQNELGAVTPEAFLRLNDKKLKQIGFSSQKAGYCRGLAEQIASGELNLRTIHSMHDVDARNHLTNIRGIGPWTADIYLLMALKRPDIWPDGDLALVSAMRKVKRLRRTPIDKDHARKVAEQWSPWKSVAARILWHYYLSELV